MDIVKNLICLENNRVSVIRYKANKLEFVKKDGEIDFPITMDFWEWWKRAVSYIEGEEVDICFIYDKNYDLLQNDEIIKKNVLNSDESIWKIDIIKNYFWKLRPKYFNLVIVSPNEQEFVLGRDNADAARRFYTNLDFKTYTPKKVSNENMASLNQNEPINEDEMTEFAKYFVDMVRRERGII